MKRLLALLTILFVVAAAFVVWPFADAEAQYPNGYSEPLPSMPASCGVSGSYGYQMVQPTYTPRYSYYRSAMPYGYYRVSQPSYYGGYSRPAYYSRPSYSYSSGMFMFGVPVYNSYGGYSSGGMRCVNGVCYPR